VFPPQIGKFNLASAHLPSTRLVTASPHITLPTAFTTKRPRMSNLLQIASKVEAAVGAYNSIQDIADRQEWKAGFERELVSDHSYSILSFYI
jgi:hypothetical protein